MTLSLDILNFFATSGIVVMLVVLGRLSQRLNSVTHVRPYYIGIYIGAGLVSSAMLVRAYVLVRAPQLIMTEDGQLIYTLLHDGLIALGVTLGLIAVWYYWSWLLAERD